MQLCEFRAVLLAGVALGMELGCSVRTVEDEVGGGSETEVSGEVTGSESGTEGETTETSGETTGDGDGDLECGEEILFEGLVDPLAQMPCVIDVEPFLPQVPYVEIYLDGQVMPSLEAAEADCALDEGWMWTSEDYNQVVLCGLACETFTAGAFAEVVALCPGGP